ncbi:hypothetical protein TNCV_1663841 [Trichonephila clavipes]|uniref:Uncharacterized protein n=1 Tax=Trichonephila clavipes TaxID=2585209 RepID=A0A8X6RWT1_TRICX|nr:hypothetical protein TNCV_1663841 [Trichonephila clavipes]
MVFPFWCLFKGGIRHAPTKATPEAESLLFGRAGITIQQLVLVTPHLVDFEAKDWRGSYTCHLFIGWIRGVAFSQRSSSPCLIEDETFNCSDIIIKLIDYEDGQEEPDSCG